MLTTMRNNRSLTFYQQTAAHQSKLSSAYAGGIASTGIAHTSLVTGTTTNAFNTQLNDFLSSLNAERDRLAQKVAQGLSVDPTYQGARHDGVSLAWDYEAADVKMGGEGSAKWTKYEQQQIMENRPEAVNKTKLVDGNFQSPKAGVRGVEGHHQQNVADHPEHQANPDNIKFYKNKQDHLNEGHDGDWKNESNDPPIDKNKMLKDTNERRVFKNELLGLGIAVAIGAGVGMTIGFIVSLAQSGVTPESIKFAAIEGAKSGVESGVMAAVGYGIGRTIGDVASKAISGLLENIGVKITEDISKMVNMGSVGALTIAVFSAYQFIKLKKKGISTREALIRVGKQALLSLSLLAVSIAAQGIWGGYAGIIVSTSIGLIFITSAVLDSVNQRHFAEKLRVYTIEKCYPTFSL